MAVAKWMHFGKSTVGKVCVNVRTLYVVLLGEALQGIWSCFRRVLDWPLWPYNWSRETTNDRIWAPTNCSVCKGGPLEQLDSGQSQRYISPPRRRVYILMLIFATVRTYVHLYVRPSSWDGALTKLLEWHKWSAPYTNKTNILRQYEKRRLSPYLWPIFIYYRSTCYYYY